MLHLVKKLLRCFFFFLPEQVVGTILFEAAAFVGSIIARPLTLNTTGRNFINLGSGSNIVRRFINIDFFMARGIDYGADLRKPLKISDDTIDGIFCEHTIEHLTYATTDHLLRECHRIMKPGGVIRIVLPDLSLFSHAYCANNLTWFKRWEELMFCESTDEERAKRRLTSPIEAISFITQEYGHVSAWDFPTLKVYLERAGFRDILQTGFMLGRSPELLIDMDTEDRKFVSLYAEALK
jgi:SAM-dependent methyltransferase